MSVVQECLEKNPSDPRGRLEVAEELMAAFSYETLPSDSRVLNDFCDMMVQWLNGSNFKVALQALQILEVALGISGDLLAPYLMDNLTPIMERLGDSKEPVRQQAQDLIIKFMHIPHSSPQSVFERLMQGFTHKQHLVRVGVMKVLQEVLRTFGSASLQVSKFLPLVAKLTADPNSQVRDTASDTLVEMYIYTGDKLASDLQKRQLLPDTRSHAVFARFQDAKRQGLVADNGEPLPDRATPDRCQPVFKTPARPAALPPSTSGRGRQKRMDEDDDTRSVGSAVSVGGKRSTSVPAQKRMQVTARYAAPSSNRGRGRMMIAGPRRGSAGAVSEDNFYKAFEDVPKEKTQFFSGKDLVALIAKIRDTLSDPNNDWDKRVEALKKIRAIVVQGGLDYPEFLVELKTLEVAFQLSARDLRSQVVREACYTIAFLSERLGTKFEQMSETLFHALVNLIQNSAKIMSSAGQTTCQFIIRNVETSKLVPVVTSYMNSKSREIRRSISSFICQMTQNWQSHMLERHLVAIQEAIRQGLNDPDPEVRALARKGYHSFAERFREQAELLFHSLEPSRQKQLVGEISASSSSGSIAGRRPDVTGIPPRGLQYGGFRSTSDIDTGAARRAMQRHRASRPPLPSAHQNSLHSTSVSGSVARPGRLNQIGLRHSATRDYPPSPVGGSGAVRSPRTTSKSVSQPGSRSGSPTSKLPLSAKKTPRSTIPVRSRDNSPGRYTNGAGRRYSTDAANQNSPPYFSHSRDIQQALFDALAKRTAYDGDSSELLETASISSERSLNRFESAEITDALRCCSSTQWSERKEGLATLLVYFRQSRVFSKSELKKICETFGRMFVDAHNKTFTVFLETLMEFVQIYKTELTDWLYILLTRLLAKLGSDLLASVNTKVTRTLEVIKESFPPEVQFNTMVRYIVDPAQVPSLKVKAATLNYTCDLVHMMEPQYFENTAETRQAVYKIIHWTTEPKSADVRRASQNLIVALFSLNAAEFSAMVGTFQKSFQDMVYQLLHSQLNRKQPEPSYPPSSINRYMRSSLSPSSDYGGARGSSGGNVDLAEVHDRLRETSAQIQNCFSAEARERQKGKGSQDSGIVDAADGFQKGEDAVGVLTNGIGLLSLGAADVDRQEEMIGDIMTELSNHNQRVHERVRAMQTLKAITRDGSFTLWDNHFKTILLILLETLGDSDPEIRANALKTLKEICLCQAGRFREYAELTLLKLLEVNKDVEKEVVKAAEECGGVLATHLPPAVCFRVLNPVILNEPHPTLLAAIKMETKVLEQLGPEELENILQDIVPGIVKAYDNDDSSVRKASVLCLVSLHKMVGGESLKPFLSELSNSKMKLLNLYIQRSQAGKS